jgi:hypothetical protein
MEELQQNKTALEGSGKPLLKNTNFLFLWVAAQRKRKFVFFNNGFPLPSKAVLFCCSSSILLCIK